MKRYVIKLTQTFATDTMAHKKGDVSEFICAKGYVFGINQLNAVKHSGWKRRCFAEKYIKQDMEASSKYSWWYKNTYEILEFDI